jgi:hypothetical protein
VVPVEGTSVTVWIVVGVGIVAALVLLMLGRGTKERDLGQVSHHWIAEHRFGQSRDTR